MLSFISILVFRGLFNQSFGEINLILGASLTFDLSDLSGLPFTVALPIAQRYLVAGLSDGAVKG